MLKSIEVLGLGMEIPVKRIKKIEIAFDGVTIDFSDEDGGDDMRLVVPLRTVGFIDDCEGTKKYSIETMKKAFEEVLNVESVNTALVMDGQKFAAIVRKVLSTDAKDAARRGGYTL